MRFEKHLFISYAHLDNRPLSEREQGWVTRFHDSLEAFLGMRLGTNRKPEIWRDQKLDGNDRFEREILDQFQQTALIVSVLTPNYLESEWCAREVREFCRAAKRSGGMWIGNKSRAFKVIKMPIADETILPDALQQALGYPFYIVDDETALELDPAFGDEFGQMFNRKVNKLACDIAGLIRHLTTSSEGDSPAGEPGAAQTAVYLAESSYDRTDEREKLAADLEPHGVRLLPDRQLPHDEADYLAEVRRLLEQSQLSIHLVGSKYGAVPHGPSQKSVVVLQNELAIERCKCGDLQRLIWLPEGTLSEHSEQRDFIRRLLEDAEAQYGADLITGDFETLKGVAHATLKRRRERVRHTDREAEGTATRLVFLVCDEQDRKATIPLRKFLAGRELKVEIPAFAGTSSEVRRANEQLLQECQAVILFYGAGDEAWKRTVENDLRRVQALGRREPLVASCTYLAEPLTVDKEDMIEVGEPGLINGLAGFSDSLMTSFLERLGA